jgi:hypothetical protein
MPVGAALSGGSSGEVISHFSAVRVRVNGTGSLRLALFSYDDVVSTTLVPLTMAASTNIVPTRLTNFQQHRASLEMKTTGIDETMRVNRIIIFAKPVFTEWPSTVYT